MLCSRTSLLIHSKCILLQFWTDYIEITSSGAVQTTILPNKFYKFTSEELTSLNLTLGAGESGKLAEYLFEFKTNDTFTTPMFSSTIKWVNGLSLESFTTYQASIINNIGIIVGVE